MSVHSDPELVARCLRGEQAAWDALVDQYSRLVYSIPRRYGLSESDAADVVQNVFVALFRSLDRLADHTRLSAWLITTAHRESWRVGKRSDTGRELDAIIADVNAPSDEQLATWERQHLVRQGLERLGGSCRELLTALFLEPGEVSYELIAERLGMRVGSIGPTRARCFKKLAKILDGLGFDEESASQE
ncbi:MAG: RNA polymerase sigma factor [Planctomycetota bacterium]